MNDEPKKGELTRLKIWAFTSIKGKDAFSKEKAGDPFEVQVNPESFSVAYSIQYSGKQGKRTSSFTPKWEKNPPRKLNFEILFDNTAALPTKQESVAQQIKNFESKVFQPKGDSHRPNFLLIEWGALIFKCCLDNMTVTYKLFAANGDPLRASASVSFQEVVREDIVVRDPAMNSPDITHAFTVKEGDTLPIMAEKVYGDTAYYVAVAQANKLIQFRNLRAGNRLLFPPINKTDA